MVIMQLAVLSVLGHQCHCLVLKKHFLRRNTSSNYPIAAHYNHKPCSNISKQQKPSQKSWKLADNVGKLLLRTLFGFVVFTDFIFTIVLLEDI